MLAPNQRPSRSGSPLRQQKDLDPFGSVVDNYDDDYIDATSSLKYLLPRTTKKIQYQKTMKSGSSAHSGVQSSLTFSGGPSGSRWDSNERVLREVEPFVYDDDRYRRRSPRRRSSYEEDGYDDKRVPRYEEERYDDRPTGRSQRYEEDVYDRAPRRGSRYDDEPYDRPRGRGPASEDNYNRPPRRGPINEDDRYDDRSRGGRPMHEEDAYYDRAPKRGSTIGEFGRQDRQRKRYAEDRNDRLFYDDDRFFEGEERFGRNMKYVDRRR